MSEFRDKYADRIQPTRAEMLGDLMQYHPPTPEKVVLYADLRAVFIETAIAIDTLCPAGADRTAAIRQLQDSLMTANRSIANDGTSYR